MFDESRDPNERLYIPLLESLDLTIAEDDRIIIDDKPLMIEDKALVIGSERRLRNGDANGVIIFHPLSEGRLNSASKVHNKLCQVVAHKLTTIISELAQNIATIAANQDLQNELSPEALSRLKPLEHLDLRAAKLVTSVLKKTTVDGECRIIRLFLKRGYDYEGTHYDRACRIEFPLLEELEKDAGTLYGIACRKHDRATLRALFRVILPKYESGTLYYNGPSNSNVAPYLDSILEAYFRVATEINGCIECLKTSTSIAAMRPIDLDWAKAREHYKALLAHMPPMEGNEGNPATVNNRARSVAAAEIAAVQNSAPPAQSVTTVTTPASPVVPAAAPTTAPLPVTPVMPQPQMGIPQQMGLSPNVNPLAAFLKDDIKAAVAKAVPQGLPRPQQFLPPSAYQQPVMQPGIIPQPVMQQPFIPTQQAIQQHLQATQYNHNGFPMGTTQPQVAWGQLPPQAAAAAAQWGQLPAAQPVAQGQWPQTQPIQQFPGLVPQPHAFGAATVGQWGAAQPVAMAPAMQYFGQVGAPQQPAFGAWPT